MPLPDPSAIATPVRHSGMSKTEWSVAECKGLEHLLNLYVFRFRSYEVVITSYIGEIL